MSFRVYSGTYHQWPARRISPANQVGRVNRTVIWIFADAEQRKPCAVMVSINQPTFKPNWELWRPYFEREETQA